MAEPPSRKPAYEPVKGLPRVPTPAEIEARRAKRAPTLTGVAPFGRDNCVDTGVGIAFKSVDRFDLLSAYIAPRDLLVLRDVVFEINRNADKVLAAGHAHIHAEVRQACRRLRKEITDGTMTVRELSGDFIDEVLEVQELVRKYSDSGSADAEGNDGHHAGEAASIVWARSQRPVAIVLTNDGGAQRAASECGVAWLNAAQIMEVLVQSGEIDPRSAWDLINQMDKVSGIAGPFPADASWRMTTR
ncbi:hypothetical protein [Cellulomonas endometrii]|uniref:hypothetical protein n=1 Tax=Cellulomonas endometrii TaxID=3036301 RepID=UPI0024AD8962|nr:hypothetical protein [Cellulomonas endometrii]